MIKQFEKLNRKEIELLFMAPVLVSVLAASGDHEISQDGKAEAIKLAHLKTFTADPILLAYYEEVETDFKKHFEETVKKYSPFDVAKREDLKKEINVLNTVIAKLDKEFGQMLNDSLTGYVRHVKRAGISILDDFIFPIAIPGLTA